MVETQMLSVFDQFHAVAERVDNESQFEQARYVAHFAAHSRASCTHTLNHCGKISKGEAQMIHHTTRAGCGGIAIEEHDAGRSEQESVGAAVDEFSADIVLIPLGCHFRLGYRHMDVVVHVGLALRLCLG